MFVKVFVMSVPCPSLFPGIPHPFGVGSVPKSIADKQSSPCENVWVENNKVIIKMERYFMLAFLRCKITL